MVANPRALKDYRRATMERSKTDKVDATVICDYATRMPFLEWQPPEAERPRHISRVSNVRLRRALYMPALVAIRREPAVGAFYEQLIARGKKPLVAIVAVMRKLLYAIYGIAHEPL